MSAIFKFIEPYATFNASSVLFLFELFLILMSKFSY